MSGLMDMILVLIMDKERPAKWAEISFGGRFGIESCPTLKIAYLHTFERNNWVAAIIFVGLGLFSPEGEPNR